MMDRRLFLGTALAGLAGAGTGAASARPLARSIRPMPRGGRPAQPQPLEEILAQSGLGAVTGFMAVDARTGAVLEARGERRAQPPASVAKIATALYARAKLGAGSRRATRLLATGPVDNGRVQGDLILVGGGDPALDTDGLANLAEAAVARGIFGVTGRFLVAHNALPQIREIDPTQPEHVGYNPAISGLNLNFNRVHFQWWRTDPGYRLALTARAVRNDPPVEGIEMRVVARETPVFAYRDLGMREEWSVAQSALGRTGSRWLPVRRPGVHAGEVFRILTAARNLRLPPARLTETARGQEVAREESAALDPMLRALLRYSTNLTAEALGLATSGAQDLGTSGARMGAWMDGQIGRAGARFANHSGLSDASRTTPEQWVRLLGTRAARAGLPGLLKDYPLAAAPRAKERLAGSEVLAKTGTLNFTRALAGYARFERREILFAIQTAELSRRHQGPGRVAERPRGAKGWANRAVAQEQALLRRWAALPA